MFEEAELVHVKITGRTTTMLVYSNVPEAREDVPAYEIATEAAAVTAAVTVRVTVVTVPPEVGVCVAAIKSPAANVISAPPDAVNVPVHAVVAPPVATAVYTGLVPGVGFHALAAMVVELIEIVPVLNKTISLSVS